MVVFAEHEDDEDFVIPSFTVGYEPAGGTVLSEDNTITVTINAPTGYIVETPLAGADNIEGNDGDLQRRTAAVIMDSGTSATFAISYYGDELVIAPTQVDLQMPPAELKAMKDPNTDGGRTKIDLTWDETYSVTDGEYAEAYRIQWSTNPDASEWELLVDIKDQDLAVACNPARECTHSHELLFAGEEYTYRIFAKNAAETMVTPVVTTVGERRCVQLVG